jgi:hypothetical protein
MYRWGLFVGDDLYPEARRLYFARFKQLLLAQTQTNTLAFSAWPSRHGAAGVFNHLRRTQVLPDHHLQSRQEHQGFPCAGADEVVAERAHGRPDRQQLAQSNSSSTPKSWRKRTRTRETTTALPLRRPAAIFLNSPAPKASTPSCFPKLGKATRLSISIASSPARPK